MLKNKMQITLKSNLEKKITIPLHIQKKDVNYIESPVYKKQLTSSICVQKFNINNVGSPNCEVLNDSCSIF